METTRRGFLGGMIAAAVAPVLEKLSRGTTSHEMLVYKTANVGPTQTLLDTVAVGSNGCVCTLRPPESTWESVRYGCRTFTKPPIDPCDYERSYRVSLTSEGGDELRRAMQSLGERAARNMDAIYERALRKAASNA